MTTRQEVLVPDIGDFTDVEIVEVMVAAGDEVSAEDSLITLETDKAAMDVPAPASGKILEMAVSTGDKVSEGSLILVLEAAGDEASDETGSDETGSDPTQSEEASQPAEQQVGSDPTCSIHTSVAGQLHLH